MIGGLLFYVLYPLSRYLTARPAEASKKGLPPAVVNGTAVWDGGAVTTGWFTQSQTTLRDPCLCPGRGTTRETKERMKEQSPQKETNRRFDTDKKQLVAILPEVTENEAIKTSKMKEDKEEVSKQDDIHVMLHRKQNTEDGTIFPTKNINPEQALGALLKCLQTDDGLQETACPVQEQVQIHTLEESVIPAEDSTQETTCSAAVQLEIQNLRESVSPAEDIRQETTCPVQTQAPLPIMDESLTQTADQTTECWDEYVAPAAVEMYAMASSPELALPSLFFDAQTHLQFSGPNDAQTGWTLPPGPGLADEVQCPLLQFPAMGYYPPMEGTSSFEIMWRVWEEMDESTTAAEPGPIPFPFTKASVEFTVMSYNILAQDLLEANQQLYMHCPMEVLDWSYRCSLVLEEIMKWAPDILCLQEVQENHYHEQLYPALSQMGYTCVYKQRTGTKTDGCATCYRNNCFSEVSVIPLELFRPETELLDRHNVGIVLLLQPVVTQGSKDKVKDTLLCVANTHLLFNPRRGDVKLAQLAIILAEIDSLIKSCKAKGEHCNIIMCGDFNSVPHMPLYQLITTGELYYQGLPAWMISGQEDLSYKSHCHRLFAPLWPNCLGITDSCQYITVKDTSENQSQKSGKCQYSHDFMLRLRYCPAACVRPVDLKLIPGVTDNTPDASRGNMPYDKSFRHTISHRLDLESVYKHILPGSGASEVTTLHSEVGATVDYIFYSPRRILTSDQTAGGDFVDEGLKLIGSLSLLSEDVLWSMNGLPNHIFPSDHLSLVARFQLDLNAA